MVVVPAGVSRPGMGVPPTGREHIAMVVPHVAADILGPIPTLLHAVLPILRQLTRTPGRTNARTISRAGSLADPGSGFRTGTLRNARPVAGSRALRDCRPLPGGGQLAGGPLPGQIQELL